MFERWFIVETEQSHIGYRAIVDGDGFTVCSPSPMGDAKARLIARAPSMREALDAVKARINGEWDNPSLVKVGPLGNLADDILRILAMAEG